MIDPPGIVGYKTHPCNHRMRLVQTKGAGNLHDIFAGDIVLHSTGKKRIYSISYYSLVQWDTYGAYLYIHVYIVIRYIFICVMIIFVISVQTYLCIWRFQKRNPRALCQKGSSRMIQEKRSVKAVEKGEFQWISGCEMMRRLFWPLNNKKPFGLSKTISARCKVDQRHRPTCWQSSFIQLCFFGSATMLPSWRMMLLMFISSQFII